MGVRADADLTETRHALMRLRGRVLAIAGSDSGGGAGIQADIKTITALGAYAATAITAITVQDTIKVHQVHTLPPSLIAAQIACALNDPGADAIKSGMLANAETIEAVAEAIAGQGRGLPYVLDPVMIATSGDALLDPAAITALCRLIRSATLITPNLHEAEALTGQTITTLADTRRAAATLRQAGATAVLLKAGHAQGDTLTDLLLTEDGEYLFPHPRQHTRHTHGTGCTLAAAVATGLAQNLALPLACDRAISFVQRAIARAPAIGAGHGPLNHAASLRPY